MSVIQLDALDIADFLSAHHVGVLALAKDGDAYAVPVSYAFDDDGPALYFRLGYTADSQKRAYLEATDHVSFVVYGETDAGWTSVVAMGPVEEAAGSSTDSTVAEAVHDLDIPYFTVHGDAADFEFHLVRLDVETLSGIVEG